jgi:hypothetical protein
VNRLDYFIFTEDVPGTIFVIFVIDVWLDLDLILGFNAVTSLFVPKLMLEIVLATLL